MMQRFFIEFVVDVPNEAVAGDVETRLARENLPRLCDVLQELTGYAPLATPKERGIRVAYEEVVWNAKAQDWLGEDDEE